jgi:sulfur-oxidizing protein SoxY
VKTLLLAGCLALVALVAPALADETDPARAERWDDLKHAVFGDRPVTDASGIIALAAPTRALDAATVPLTVTLPQGAGEGASRVTAIWLMVDDNPSPLVGTFRFGPAGDPTVLKTRVRVDQYTLIHAVAETQDGRLFSTVSYVKAAGGCSAPSSKDAEAAAVRIGQMRLRVDAAPADGGPEMAHLLVSHPNYNGMQVDQLKHTFIPARYIQDIEVHDGDDLALSVQADISLSEDPEITFGLRPSAAGKLRVDMTDSTTAAFHQDFPPADRS